jgi:hypothetical protein
MKINQFKFHKFDSFLECYPQRNSPIKHREGGEHQVLCICLDFEEIPDKRKSV